MKTILIASLSYPSREQFDAFHAQIKRVALESHNVAIGELEVTDGPGCANIAFNATGTDEAIERLANGLTMAMMPARWTYASSPAEHRWHMSTS